MSVDVMSVNVYDRSLQAGDLFEVVQNAYAPHHLVGKIGVLTQTNYQTMTEACLVDIDGGERGYAIYKCALRRLDDAKSFVPEDWS